MKIAIADCEANGLLVEDKHGNPPATHLHCWVSRCYHTGDVEVFTHNEGKQLLNHLASLDVLVGHNFFSYDLPLLTKLFRLNWTPYSIFDKKCKIIDTLALSRALSPDRKGGHGLEAWGKKLGRWKPEIEDWHNLPLDVYIHRCKEDVEINYLVYKELLKERGEYV